MQKKILGIILCAACAYFILAKALADQCSPPPFISISPLPNVLIAFDNSASMYDLAYTNDPTFCYDNTYKDNNTYYGFYEKDTFYKYDNATRFNVWTTWPSSCDNTKGTTYFCIKESSGEYYFKGNFLNWLTMSKLDLIKTALTGGKYDQTSQVLIGESRGCVGRRFIKEIPGSGYLFAVRGSQPLGHGYEGIYVGGTTNIEVLKGPSGGLNMEFCFKALEALQSGNLGQLQSNTDDCLGLTQQSNALAAFNHSMQTCWSLNPENKPEPGTGDITRMEEACEKVLDDIKSDNGTPQWSLLDPFHAAYVCSSKNNGDNQTNPHYVGDCYKLWDNCTKLCNGSKGNDKECKEQCDTCIAQYDNCTKKGLLNYCNILRVPEVMDPSSELASGSYSNVPAILIESGALGQSGSNPIITLKNRKKQDSAPKGLLHEFIDKMNLGIIRMNIGSKTEISDNSSYYYTDLPSEALPDADGGKVISPIQGHNLGVIHAFNDLKAYSWTPIGELFYEAARYFQGEKSAYNQPITYTSPIKNWCDKNFIILLSDGGSTYDQNLPGTTLVSLPVTDTKFDIKSYLVTKEQTETNKYKGTKYAKGVAWWAHTRDFRPDLPDNQTITFFAISALGGADGVELLKDIAKYGGFVDYNKNRQPDNGTTGSEFDADRDGIPDTYIQVDSPQELFEKLRNAFQKILDQGGGAGAVATVTQEVLGQDLVIRGAFTAYDDNPDVLVWKGHLETYWPFEGCHTLGAANQSECEKYAGCFWDGTACQGWVYDFQLPRNQGKFCASMGTDRHCWDAGEFLKDESGRKLFTYLEGATVYFDNETRKADIITALENDTDWDEDGLTNDEDAEKLLEWVLGWDNASLTRDRNGWILGDIVYSTPVVVGPPSISAVDSRIAGYCADCSSSCAGSAFYCYRQKLMYRKKMVYVGANDGMLHAFVVGVWDNSNKRWIYDSKGDSSVGKELWAYVPSNLLPEMKELARPTYGQLDGCKHRTMVDLSPVAWDVLIDHDNKPSTPRQWRTVLLGGERGGGDVFFAIDVTDPDNPKVLWEYAVLRNMDLETSDPDNATPFDNRTDYDLVRTLPVAWTVPHVGYMSLPKNASFSAVLPAAPLETGKISFNFEDWKRDHLSGWFAVMGATPRVFAGDRSWPNSLSLKAKKALSKPYLMVIDIEKGVNIFQKLWPEIINKWSDQWPQVPDNSTVIPYALGDALVVDIWDSYGNRGSDGSLDHIYFGDVNGNFYGMKLFSPDNASLSIMMDVWKTKEISSLASPNTYRSNRQPVSAMPVATLDPEKNLRVYFGTGKFDHVLGGHDDKADNASMSFYGLREPSEAPADFTEGLTLSNVKVNSEFHCTGSSFLDNCTWVKNDGHTPDCCESSCSSACWTCVLDLKIPGERVLDSALVAGGVVFFTTFVPKDDVCLSGGDAYLYAVDYLCRKMPWDPFDRSGFKKVTKASPETLKEGEYTLLGDGKAYVLKIGDGMPSRPVLDSSGEHVFIQTSNGEIHRLRLNLPDPVQKMGWKQR